MEIAIDRTIKAIGAPRDPVSTRKRVHGKKCLHSHTYQEGKKKNFFVPFLLVILMQGSGMFRKSEQSGPKHQQGAKTPKWGRSGLLQGIDLP